MKGITTMTYYCIRCGVELAESEHSCPLCNTKLVIPDEDPRSFDSKRSYPPSTVSVASQRYQNHRKARDISSAVIAVLLLIPCVVTLLCDALGGGGLSWSLYVLSSCAVAAAVILPPVVSLSLSPYSCISIGTLSIAVFLYIIESLSGGGWFFSFALPLCIGSGGILMLLTAMYCRKLSPARIIAVGFACIGFYCILIELLCFSSFGLIALFSWSLYPASVLFILAALLLYIDYNDTLKRYLAKKFFI